MTSLFLRFPLGSLLVLQSLVSQADGVLFHASTFQKRDGFPKVKPPRADYVFVNLEPRTYRPVKTLLRDDRVRNFVFGGMKGILCYFAIFVVVVVVAVIVVVIAVTSAPEHR